MPDTPSITLVKRMTYRTLPEEWSNTYHFSGTTPGTAAEWKTLGLAIHATEKTIYGSDVKLVEIYGYEAGNNISVAQIDMRTGAGALPPGTLSFSGVNALAGNDVVTCRALIGTGSTGKKVYIRKYFHGSAANSTSPPDGVAPAALTAMTAHLTALLGGGLPGGATWCGPQAQAATVPVAMPWVTTRTLKRRGKRP